MPLDTMIDGGKLNACLVAEAEAIRNKSGNTSQIVFDYANNKGFAEAIENIPSGKTLIQFKDYDGILIRAYTLEEIQAMTELPSPPTHDNLTFLGWTKNLEALKNYPYSVSVYPKFKVSDGKTRIWISFTNANKAPTIRFAQSKSQGILFDWGDGTTERISGTGNLTRAHTYASVGSYVITITPDADCTWTPNWGGSSSNTLFPSYGSMVTKVEFGDNISTLGACAFYNYSNLRSILLPEGISSIADSFCYGCLSLRYITIPSSVTTIYSSAFNSCISLEQLDIPDTVTNIYNGAFSDCHGLKKVFIPPTCQSVCTSSANSSWLRGSKLKSAGYYGTGKDIEYGWEQLVNYAFNYNTYLEEIAFPNNCTVIPSYAFQNCTSLKSITIPGSVSTIGTSAFYGCSSLIKLEIPSSVKTIGTSALNNCYNLQKLIIKSDLSSIPTSTNTYISGCYKLKTASPINEGGDIEFTWTKTLYNGAFGYTNLEHIIFPEGLETINGFYNCRYLEHVIIPDGVKAIGSYCFYGCINLKSITIPSSVIEVGSNAFVNCTLLKELVLHNVTNINSSAIFQGMTSLEHIQIGSVGYGVTASRNDIFSYTYNPSLIIEVYTVANYINTLLSNIRNGANSATIVFKASSDTVYNGMAYKAGETILISEVS